MKKKVTFEKQIEFPMMIGEVSAISLEPDLRFIDQSNVEGNLNLTGKYKLTEASYLEENFEYKIPIKIVLQEKLDLNSSKVEITDFTYKIENDDTLICNIELLVEGLEVIEDLEEDRECDDKPYEKEIEIPKIEDNVVIDEMDERVEETEKEEKKESIEENKNSSLFFNFNEDSETYGTFIVYMVRQNESINSIIEKYNTTLEDIEKYNDIKNIEIGSKLIIPLKNE